MSSDGLSTWLRSDVVWELQDGIQARIAHCEARYEHEKIQVGKMRSRDACCILPSRRGPSLSVVSRAAGLCSVVCTAHTEGVRLEKHVRTSFFECIYIRTRPRIWVCK